MTVRIIVRVSTAEQAAGTSLDEQERRCRGAALVLGDEEPVVYRDAGVSGAVPLSRRPAGGRMWQELERGDIVIAAKMDRIFRSARDALQASEDMSRKGVKLILVDMGSDPVNGNGAAKMFFTIMAAMAEFERGRIAERMADGRKAKRAAGGYLGGRTAEYGWRSEGEGKESRLVEVPEEQRTIELARAHRGKGKSLAAVAAALTKAGRVSRTGNPFRSEQIRRMLREGR